MKLWLMIRWLMILTTSRKLVNVDFHQVKTCSMPMTWLSMHAMLWFPSWWFGKMDKLPRNEGLFVVFSVSIVDWQNSHVGSIFGPSCLLVYRHTIYHSGWLISLKCNYIDIHTYIHTYTHIYIYIHMSACVRREPSRNMSHVLQWSLVHIMIAFDTV